MARDWLSIGQAARAAEPAGAEGASDSGEASAVCEGAAEGWGWPEFGLGDSRRLCPKEQATKDKVSNIKRM